MACKQYALGACGLQVVEAHLGAAGEVTVGFCPVDEHPLALYSCRFSSAESVAGVAVVLGDCGDFTGEILATCLCPGVGGAVVAAYLAGGAGGGVGQLCRIDGAGGAVGVGHGDCAGCGGGVTGVGVGVTAQAVVVGVTRGDHGENAGAGERVNGVGFGVVLRAVGEVAVTVGVEGTVERLDNDVGAAAATEDAEGVDFSVGGDAGADFHCLELLCGELAVVAGKGAAVGVYAVACRRASHVGAVAAGGAVERVAVGNGGVATVVVVTDEVVATSNLGAVDEAGVCGGQLGELGCLLVVCVNGGARVLAVLGQDGRDFLHVGAVGERLDGLGVTAHCHATYCVVGGVENLGAGLVADLLCLALHLGGDGLHLRALVDGCLRAGAYACGLGLFKGALTFESDEGGDGAAGALHAFAEYLLGGVGVFRGVGGGAQCCEGAQCHAEGE